MINVIIAEGGGMEPDQTLTRRKRHVQHLIKGAIVVGKLVIFPKVRLVEKL